MCQTIFICKSIHGMVCPSPLPPKKPNRVEKCACIISAGSNIIFLKERLSKCWFWSSSWVVCFPQLFLSQWPPACLQLSCCFNLLLWPHTTGCNIQQVIVPNTFQMPDPRKSCLGCTLPGHYLEITNRLNILSLLILTWLIFFKILMIDTALLTHQDELCCVFFHFRDWTRYFNHSLTVCCM